MEINTAGLHKPVREAYPSPEILRRLREAGVPITFGSDAHRPEEVGRDFAHAAALARAAGYDAFAALEPDPGGGRAGSGRPCSSRLRRTPAAGQPGAPGRPESARAVMKAAVIFNPSSGRGRAGAIASAVERGLTKRGLDCELHATRQPKEAITLAERYSPQADIVVAIGGDGTVNEVTNGMARARDKVGARARRSPCWASFRPGP